MRLLRTLDYRARPRRGRAASEIELVSGLTPDPVGGNPGFTVITGNNTVTQNILKVGATTPVGSPYRFNITATARDC